MVKPDKRAGDDKAVSKMKCSVCDGIGIVGCGWCNRSGSGTGGGCYHCSGFGYVTCGNCDGKCEIPTVERDTALPAERPRNHHSKEKRMTKDEFQKRYHFYQTHSEEEAKAEATHANLEGIEDDEAVAVEFGKLGWCLMLKSAWDYLVPILNL